MEMSNSTAFPLKRPDLYCMNLSRKGLFFTFPNLSTTMKALRRCLVWYLYFAILHFEPNLEL